MNTQALPDSAALNIPTTATTDQPKKRSWWNPFTRTDKPRKERLGSRRQAIADLRSEHTRLVEALEKLNERLDGTTETSGASMEIDPMPVIKGIEGIASGQKEISASLGTLNRVMEQSQATGNRLASAVEHVDETLDGVRQSQSETAGAVSKVGDRMEEMTSRFETLFDKMAQSEQEMAIEYKKLQQKTMFAIAGIAGAVILVLTLFMTVPWA